MFQAQSQSVWGNMITSGLRVIFYPLNMFYIAFNIICIIHGCLWQTLTTTKSSSQSFNSSPEIRNNYWNFQWCFKEQEENVSYWSSYFYTLIEYSLSFWNFRLKMHVMKKESTFSVEFSGPVNNTYFNHLGCFIWK